MVRRDNIGLDVLLAALNASLFLSFAVTGVTHENATPKSRANITLEMEEPSQGLELDVTVVIQLNDNLNVSEWYYSRYILNAVEREISKSPSQSPSSMPTEESNAPTETPDGVVAISMNVGVLFLGVVGAMWFL